MSYQLWVHWKHQAAGQEQATDDWSLQYETHDATELFLKRVELENQGNTVKTTRDMELKVEVSS